MLVGVVVDPDEVAVLPPLIDFAGYRKFVSFPVSLRTGKINRDLIICKCGADLLSRDLKNVSGIGENLAQRGGKPDWHTNFCSFNFPEAYQENKFGESLVLHNF